MKEKRLFLHRLVAYKDNTFGLLSYDEQPMLTWERKWTEDKNIVGYRANFTCIPTGTHKIKLEMQTDMTYRMRISRFGYQRNAIFGSEKNMLRLPPGSVSLFQWWPAFEDKQYDPEAVKILQDYMEDLYIKGWFSGSGHVFLHVRESSHFKVRETEKEYKQTMNYLAEMNEKELEDYAAF